ncbi:hypothetical protein SAMN05216328_1434 [Ensifer sp. YR511]|nr:hypothetical protein SAMN05216328_1434 [Ensifer sp. YR511]
MIACFTVEGARPHFVLEQGAIEATMHRRLYRERAYQRDALRTWRTPSVSPKVVTSAATSAPWRRPVFPKENGVQGSNHELHGRGK